MAVGLLAILPKTRISVDSVPADLIRAHNRQLDDVQRRMQKYPPATSPTYRRTGTYGRSWRRKVSPTQAELVNRTPYAVYPGGPHPGAGPNRRQARVMRRKGWVSITDAARAAAKEHRNLINRAIKGRRVPGI